MDLAALGLQLHSLILNVFSNLSDSMILHGAPLAAVVVQVGKYPYVLLISQSITFAHILSHFL